MYYSSFGILAVVLHLILNHDVLKNGKNEPSTGFRFRYRQFLNALLIFYISDLLWGFLVESKIRPIAYADTFLFFASMAISVLLWTRYVAAYIDKKRRRSTSFLIAGWVIAAFVMILLIANFFTPIVFTFTDDSEYVPGYGRYILLIVQFLLFVIMSLYSLFVSHRSEGHDRTHYLAVSASGGVMAVLIVIQSLFPYAPFYTIGCLIANVIIHVFVEEDEMERLNRIAADAKKINSTFSQIAESLASNYDVIYFVDIENEDYMGYTANNIYGELNINETGKDFFAESRKNAEFIVHPKDKDRMCTVMDRDYLLTALEDRKQFEFQYRLIVDGKEQYTRMVIRKSSDEKHLIVCVENVENEIKREKEHIRALNTEKELARRDELTGVRNKTAFSELEQSIQNNIDRGMTYLPFALAVCDLNDLKKINDTKGHKAGDDYIKSSAQLLCKVFDHSPVFRIGGDEFAIFLSGDDYSSRKQLVDQVHQASLSNKNTHEGPVIAIGMAEYEPANDLNISDIFDRADHIMYEDKRELKAI